jgi:phosphoesterase RecJ-like protein
MSTGVGAFSCITPADVASVPAKVVQALRAGRRVLTVCHENPESDALGSALALALALEELGAVATPVCADPVPTMYGFMPRIERFRQAPDPAIDYDLIVVSDCGELERVGSLLTDQTELFGRLPLVNIDHHKSNPGFGTVDWIDASAAATCEMVTLLMPALGVPLTAADGAIAASLMAGVVIDTATFAHPSTTPRTLRVAAELLSVGAPLADISRLLYRTKPVEQLALFGRVLARLQTAAEGRIAWATMTDEDLVATGARPEHSEGLIDLMSQAAGTEVAILFKESGDTTRVSVRTREGGVDATTLTGAFGGGGHIRAAGATVQAPVEQAVPSVLDEARRLVASLPS